MLCNSCIRSSRPRQNSSGFSVPRPLWSMVSCSGGRTVWISWIASSTPCDRGKEQVHEATLHYLGYGAWLLDRRSRICNGAKVAGEADYRHHGLPGRFRRGRYRPPPSGPDGKGLGTQLVFDYKVGAGGNVASEYVAKARSDGYTILLGTSATHGVNAALYKRLPFDVESDFTPIAPLNDVSNVLTINPGVIDASSVKDFIAKVKANPGKYNFASTGNGTGTHLAFAQFVKMAGLEMVHVPYKGGPEALQAVVTGEVCCIMNQVQTVLGQSPCRQGSPARRDHQTKSGRSAGCAHHRRGRRPGYESFIWFGLFGPKGLDPAIVERINLAVKKALEVPAGERRW